MIKVQNGRIWYCYGRNMKFVGRVKGCMTNKQVIEVVNNWLRK